MSLKDIRKILLVEFWVPIALCLILIILYENDILLVGRLSDEKMYEYYLAIAMELITICLIPISLRLFKFKKIKTQLQSTPDMALRKWGSIRMDMLALPMFVNCFLYYQFINVAFGYLGIIDLLCMVFVYPSKTRCEQETSKDTSSNSNLNSNPNK